MGTLAVSNKDKYQKPYGNNLPSIRSSRRISRYRFSCYEWKREGENKIPYYFLREDKKIMYIAGIYENSQFCLVTEEANKNIVDIHHRQPVILNEVDVNRYLNIELNGSGFLKECKKPNLEFYEISKNVNKPTNNSISLIQRVLN